MRVLLIDHLDSFVHVLADALRTAGAHVHVLRGRTGGNDLVREIDRLEPRLLVLSPGPGHPEEAPATRAVLRMRPEVPVLGICLGFQILALSAGGRVVRGPRPVHGRASLVRGSDDPLFREGPDLFLAARYHSLIVPETPPGYRVIARTVDEEPGLIMAMRHETLPRVGFLFHPESFLTPEGPLLLERVLAEAADARRPIPCRTGGNER